MDIGPSPWPDQTGDFGPPRTRGADVAAALEHGQPFRVVDYSGQPRCEGNAWPDGRILADAFITEDGHPPGTRMLPTWSKCWTPIDTGQKSDSLARVSSGEAIRELQRVGNSMAQQVSVTITCDVCGSTKDTRTRTISLDGQAREIDLCGKDGRALDKVAGKYVPFARKVKRTPATGRRTLSDRERSADIRAWAKTQGFQVSDRGRIPENVEREYAAAH